MKNKIFIPILVLNHALSYAQKLPELPTISAQQHSSTQKKKSALNSKTTNKVTTAPIDDIPHGKELVSIDFPNGVNLSDIIRTIGSWTGKNFVLGQGVSGGAKISIISQEPITKEEAYQAFLSALNISGFTTVETGKIVKVLPISNARSSNIKTYYGENWAPATDEIINHVVPLRYIDVNVVMNQLRPLIGLTQVAAFTTTNSLIITDTGNRIRRLIEVIKLLDDKTSQSQVSIVAVNYTDAKDMATKITEIFGTRGGTNISLQKALIDERTNSLILVGPAHTLDDIVRFIQRIDKPTLNQSAQALIRVRTLDYADAEKLAQTLQALSQNTNVKSKISGGGAGAKPPYLPTVPNTPAAQASPASAAGGASAADISGVKVTADKSTNSLIIEGSASAYNELDLIISQLDKRKAQVYIEANMIDLSINNHLNWQPASLGGGSVGSNATIPFGFNVTQALPFTVAQTGTTTTASAALGSVGNNAVLGILSNTAVTIGGISLSPGALIFALKENVNNNVLQTPSMMVSDNEAANFTSAQVFNVSQQVTNPNGNGIVTQNTKYDATTALKVTPQISRADYVNLKISLQLDNVGPVDANNVPTVINKRSAESVVTVQNGQTAVLGGITSNTIVHSESKVPLLGDIPIIGWLFKQVIDKKDKTSLTLLITPHVVRDADDLAIIYQSKIKARDEFLKAFYGNKFKQQDFYAQYPTEEDGMARHYEKNTDDEAEKEEKARKLREYMDERANVLPSQEANPINAPVVDSVGGGMSTSNISPAQ